MGKGIFVTGKGRRKTDSSASGISDGRTCTAAQD